MITPQTINHRLENKEVDLIIGIDSSQKLPSYLIVQHWLTQPFSCLVAQNRTAKAFNLRQYCASKHVIFLDAMENSSSIIDNWLAAQDLQRQHIARAVNYMAAARVVAKTSAIMTLPLDMAKLFSEMLPVMLVEPPQGLPNIEMNLVHHPLYNNDKSLMWLIEQIRQLAA